MQFSTLLDPNVPNRFSSYGESHDMTRLSSPNDVLIKPTHACPARCSYCSDMLDWYYDRASVTKGLNFEKYKSLIDEFKKMGVQRLTISGGEPTLYPHLFQLIEYAQNNRLHVTLNTNGWNLSNEKFLTSLCSVPPDLLICSFDSHIAQVHDECRMLPGLFQNLTLGLSKIRELRRKDELQLSVGVRTIIHKRNYADFDQLISFLKQFDLDVIRISYIENDHNNKNWLLSVQQISKFREVILPKAIEAIKAFHFSSESAYRLVEYQLKTLFIQELISFEDYSNGNYWPDERIEQFCDLPSKFAVITPSGQVLPCNEAEYRQGPVMGNVNDSSFQEIWESKVFDNCRKKKFGACRTCAGPLPMQLTIKETMENKLVSKR